MTVDYEASFELTHHEIALSVRRYWSLCYLRRREIVATLVFIAFLAVLAAYRSEPSNLVLSAIVLMPWAGRAIHYVRSRRAALKLLPGNYKLSVGSEGLSIWRASDEKKTPYYQTSTIGRIYKYNDMWLIERASGRYVYIPVKGMPADVLDAIDKLSSPKI